MADTADASVIITE